MNLWKQTIVPWIQTLPIRLDIFWIIIVLVIAFILHKIVKKIMTTSIKKIAKKMAAKTKGKLDDYILKGAHFERLALIVYIVAFAFLSTKLNYAGGFKHIPSIFSKTAHLLGIWIVLRIIHCILNSLTDFTENEPKFKGKPYRSYIQIIIIILYLLAIFFAVGSISGKSLWVLLSGVGAMTAVVLLIFRETILSFVSSIQISTYDLVRKGDWISVPKYGTDGDVKEVALHAIKIQNWDKTISVLPTNDLMRSGFKNWRGMQETGGRRIKRSIFLDLSSIKFMDKKMKAKIGKIKILQPYFDELEKTKSACYDSESEQPLNEPRLTNIGTFRIYIEKYLRNLDCLRQDFTFLVRQLEPGPTGVPIEIYVFTATTNWNEYELIQADIFDHLFAATKEFDLKMFQYGSKPLMK